ncbi:hypothetical protein [Micromonospora phaseoli]|uniref:hypothetical protein n=1 Tax=Micromonospora phaseoli TaxID=1144548 RepID=UPI00111374E2|nr:hypothetical protein [Micromonospora phaseoli]GIJ80357.1 hypothetical protein Xph01_47890 [Micromonospora phaseoli]
MDLHDLNDATRAAMIEEAEADIKAGALYMSRRLNGRGTSRWPQVLLDAIRSGDPASLAICIQAEALLVSREISYRNGKPYEKKVPINAAETLAEGEFVRFYMRAVCIQALGLGAKVRVYRAKFVMNPRRESEAKIGSVIDPAELLEDLRRNIGVDTFLGLPPGPNSGLCVRLI